MKRQFALVALLAAFAPYAQTHNAANPSRARRIVILKVDGLNADLLYRNMREQDPATGKSRLPWLTHIFEENGTIFDNFYTRGISLSAPSWSMLDTGHHTVIRGNVEYDRYTGRVYDYLNFIPFYLGYARNREVDMPGVEVLDRAGIPLVSDAFPYAQRFQSFELYQRGVRWSILEHAAERQFSSRFLFSILESAGGTSLDDVLARQTEEELDQNLKNPLVLYLDFFTGDIDHLGHATSDPADLLAALKRLDALAGRLWTAIEDSPYARQTLLAVVSDHGMNNVPGVFSEAFSLPDLLNSPAGGAHHVITDRHQLQEFKLSGLDPLVHRVITPSTASFYLAGQSAEYPTAWLDLDGNERAAVHLRNSDLNKIHILLLQLAKPDLPRPIRVAAVACLRETIDRHRAAWTGAASSLDEEMSALARAIAQRKVVVAQQPKKWTLEQHDNGEDKAARRLSDELQSWERERVEYAAYAAHLRALMAFHPDALHPFHGHIAGLIPEMSLGDNNTVRDLAHYVAGPAPGGLVIDANGNLDEAQSFRYIDYFSLLAAQRVRNNPQPGISDRPIDFTAARLPDDDYAGESGSCQHAYWLYADEQNQLVVLTAEDGRIALRPVQVLTQDETGKVHWSEQDWRPGLPLHLFEDPNLSLPPGNDRATWLSGWHTEREWLDAIHRCEYSDGVIGVTEELSPVEDNVPGPPGVDPVLLQYERRRRELVQADFHVFAANHWNFNTRNFNPGGNHGAFFRISTHSVWALAGAGVPKQHIQEPYDSLNFASTVLSLAGKAAPMPGRVVPLQ